ncbi:MAG: hypothetical protein IJ496_06500 [Ruminococcus sp.]|nr:hypothetical protein [Ruminococcus sp.]
MAQSRNEKKLEKLRIRYAELTQRIKEDTQERAQIEHDIEMLEAAAITSFMKANKIIPDKDFMSRLALTQKLVNSGYSSEEMEQLFDLKKAREITIQEGNKNEDV